MLVNLDQGTSDLDCGAAKNASREQRFIFSSQPLYSVFHVVGVRASEAPPAQSFEDLSKHGSPIVALRGAGVTRFLERKMAGNEKPILVQTPDEALHLVAEGRVKAFYYHSLGLNYYLDQEWKDKGLIVAPAKFHSYDHWVMFSRHLPEDVVVMLDAAISHLVETGAVEKILKRYTN
ncbi:extracellular solute-binding protein (family 3) [Roseibium hamelinense]|uniref:Extracellular solute-binding protein (Family 3) n=2 Tax=Roseibium hamelinense TaxID=150831 RepID=A0A562TI57_9HYPH|nr:extracellular solute-binding protein (family 3) [Roseibium hamelinense]